jgi:hypothetical protein
MTIVPYQAEHLLAISAQEAQRYLGEYTARHAKALEQTHAFTVMVDDKPVACGGVLDHWQGRHEVWAYIAGNVGPRVFLQIHHAVKRFFDAHSGRRIEAYVDCQFPEGHRWAQALGFELETERLRGYWPNGRDAACYVRVK